MLNIISITFGPFQENTFILHEGGEAIIVDPGCSNAREEKQLQHVLTSNAIRPVRLVNTHGHIDHVMGNAFVHKQFGILPEIHKADLGLLQAAPQVGRIYGVHCEPSPTPDKFIEEHDKIELGNTRFKVLFVPGHAPGHIALYAEKEKALISGDVLFQRSIGRTDLPGGNMKQLLRSIREKLWPLPDDVRVYCGHGPTTTIGEERRGNPFLKDQ